MATKTYNEAVSAGHPFTRMFDELSIPRLHVAIEQGRLVDVCEPSDLRGYVAMALTALSPDPPDGRADLADEFGCRLVCALSGDSQRLREDAAGRLYLDTGAGEVEVTLRVVRHWEWLYMIMRYDEAAHALLVSAPEELVASTKRDLADRRAFAEIVAHLDDPAEGENY